MKARLVFIDESGLLMAPLVKRSWALRGHTPILYQKTRSHKKVSIIAALSVAPERKRVGLYFSLHPNRNINAAMIVCFLKKLRRHLQKPLLIVWDRLSAHRSKRVQKYAAGKQNLRIVLLPPYAPELNPVEPFWNYLKHHALPNYAAEDALSLSQKAGYRARRICKRPCLLRSFLYKTPLFSRHK